MAVTKRIAMGVLFLMGCTAETTVLGTNAPSAPEADPPPAPLVTNEVESVGGSPLLTWGFEPASPDCNGWPVAGGTSIRANPPRTGTYSCKVCATGEAPELLIGRDVGAVSAGRYVMSAWIRKRNATPAPTDASAHIVAETTTGAVVRADAPSIAVREEWDRIEATIDLPEDAAHLRVTVNAPVAERDHCLFIDDVTLNAVR